MLSRRGFFAAIGAVIGVAALPAPSRKPASTLKSLRQYGGVRAAAEYQRQYDLMLSQMVETIQLAPKCPWVRAC